MKNLIIFVLMFSFMSCKRCFECECYKGNSVSKESKCRTYYINTESKSHEAQMLEKEIEVEKGYDNCECW